jgi:hypothetical protein
VINAFIAKIKKAKFKKCKANNIRLGSMAISFAEPAILGKEHEALG